MFFSEQRTFLIINALEVKIFLFSDYKSFHSINGLKFKVFASVLSDDACNKKESKNVVVVFYFRNTVEL